MPTRDQDRAKRAYNAIEAVHRLNREKYSKKYGGLCLKLPAMIQFNGLCQTLGFHEAKAKGKTADESEHARLLNDLAAVMETNQNGGQLTAMVRTAELAKYMQLTSEALACATWLKRYAEAVLRVEPGAEEE